MDRPNIDRLTQQALDHVWFPLVDGAEMREAGPGILVSAKGLEITTGDGKTWLDMMGTQTRANSLGFGQEDIAKAVYEQLVNLHYAGCFAQAADVTVALATKIAELSPGRLTTTLFAGSGSEANEMSLKFAKQYHHHKGAKPRASKVIARWGFLSWRHHGRAGRDGLAGYPAYLRAGCARHVPHPRANLLSLPVRPDLSELRSPLRRLAGKADPA